jgi:predicted CXXCH cytochrome family protein
MNAIEISLCFAVAAVALLPLVFGRGRSRALTLVAISAGVACAACYAPGQPRPPGNADGLPQQVADEGELGYVSSSACRSCHPGAYDSWHASFHRTMTQVATPQTVVAPFDNIELQSRGRSYLLERRGDEFWVRMADPDYEALLERQGADPRRIMNPPLVERRIFMTTGSHHMQGYWVKSKFGNLMRQIPWYYLIAEQRWVPREDVFLEPPDDIRHFATWNDACVLCHSVAGNPRMDIESGTGIPHSDVAEFGIACEACHGPAFQHVARHRNPLTRYRSHFQNEPDPSIVNPGRLTSQRSSEVCGSCHAFSSMKNPRDYFTQGLPYRPGDDLQASFPTVHYDPGLDDRARDIFWSDGTCRTGGDEFNGVSASACFQKGELSCLSCHSMHHSDPDDQLARNMNGNQACLQCHAKYRDRIEEHTHHPASSAGSLCYNCHMPFTSYALLTALRSHRIDSPSVATSAHTGRPNACNLCHLDQTLDWAAGHLSSWYGAPPVETTEEQKTIAASLLWLYRGDAVQRAVAGWNLGWSDAQRASGADWIAPHVAQLLDDPYSAVRFVGERSLRTLPGFEHIPYDFIGRTSDRTQTREQVRMLWQRGGGTEPGRELKSLILEDVNRLDQDVVDRLLSTRDLRPVKVSE